MQRGPEVVQRFRGSEVQRELMDQRGVQRFRGGPEVVQRWFERAPGHDPGPKNYIHMGPSVASQGIDGEPISCRVACGSPADT